MRKSVMVSVVLHVLTGAVALLWLLWYFVPTGNVFKGLATLLIVILAGGLVWKNCRRRDTQTDGAVSTVELPLLDTQGPVVLVCGDGLDTIFQGQPLRKTAQGWWLRAGNVGQLTDVVRSIQLQFPRQTGQLSVMYVCQPDKHQDEAVLRASLKTLRQQIRQLSTLTGFALPVVLNCEFSGPETPWVIVRGDKPVVCPANESPLAFADWQQTGNNLSTLPVLSQAFTFIRDTLLDELEKPDRITLPVRPFAVALRIGAVSAEAQSVWAHWLYRRTCLQLPHTAGCVESASRFPDAVLPLLAPFASPVQGGQRTRRVVLLLWFCALTALVFSANNNRYLIRQVGADLQRWHAIPMDHYAPKAQSLAALKQNALLLERWQRQGEPMRYSLGYYPGQRLWLSLQQAIDTYLPPPPSLVPVEKKTPQTVRLDALSLFDTGKYQLKPNSTKMLVNALIGIKAKPGWLIVVAGHTDNTGDANANQVLSLKRAEALRDWMLSTSDVSPTCFAVQGYGATRPIVTNDTVEGREANRRVEISLVPQVDACKAPAPQDSSND
jgi:outer membrane protein OmpA-like peptidoglycan-associated protein